MGFNTALLLNADVMTSCAAAVRSVARSIPSKLTRAERRAASALLLEKPLKPKLPLVGITNACDAAPVTNRLLPPVEIIAGTVALTLSELSASDNRPPHPVLEDVVEIDACHSCC